MAVFCATDLGRDFNLDRFIRRGYEDPTIFLEGSVAWSMSDDFATRLGMEPCRACGGRDLRRNEYCARRDRSGLDGRVIFPGLKVDERPDQDYEAEPEPRPVPAPTARKARLSRKVARALARKAAHAIA